MKQKTTIAFSVQMASSSGYILMEANTRQLLHQLGSYYSWGLLDTFTQRYYCSRGTDYYVLLY